MLFPCREEPLQKVNSRLNDVLRPTWTKLGVSLLAAIILGGGGLFLYLVSTCFNGQDCAAYSPVRIFAARLLSFPIFLMQQIFFGSVDNVTNFDPIIWGKQGWLALWAYYYLLVSAVSVLMSYCRRNSRGRF